MHDAHYKPRRIACSTVATKEPDMMNANEMLKLGEAALKPGGRPSATELAAACDVDVKTFVPSVTMKVANVGDAVIVGIADAFIEGPFSNAV